MRYNPSNGMEYHLFLEINCEDCKKYDDIMRADRDINTCDILFKILDQMGFREGERPDVYIFKDDELYFGKNGNEYPPNRLKKELK